MQVKGFLNYFKYIARNWDLRIAIFVIFHEIRGEMKYGLDTIGIDDLRSLGDRNINITHATMYMPLNYYVLENLMKQIIRHPGNGAFLDIGCGKGRVTAVAAYYHFEKITGIDFSNELCLDAVRNTNRIKQRLAGISIEIFNRDAEHFDIPEDACTIFFFNPFDAEMMCAVLENILISLERKPRTLRIVYANPQYKFLFLEKGFVEIYHLKKLAYLEGSILEKKQPV
jgi:SAM-dependent methyltransferase